MNRRIILWVFIGLLNPLVTARAETTPTPTSTDATCYALLAKPLSRLNAFYSDLILGGTPPLRVFPFVDLHHSDYIPALYFTMSELERTVAAVNASEEAPTFANTAFPVMNAIAHYMRVRQILKSMAVLIASPKLDEAEDLVVKMDVDVQKMQYLNLALYQRLKSIPRNNDLTKDQLAILDDWLTKSEKMGLTLPTEQKQELEAVQGEIQRHMLAFRKLYAEAQRQGLYFASTTRFDAGVPQAFLKKASDRARAEGHSDGYVFGLNQEQTNQTKLFLEYASDEQDRQRFFEAYINRNKGAFDTRSLTVETANLRLRLAKLLNAKNFAETVLPWLMVNTQEKLRDFIDAVKPEAQKMLREEMADIQAMKLELTGSAELKDWDVQYYAKKVEIRRLNGDVNEAMPYLEVRDTLDRLLQQLGPFWNGEFHQIHGTSVWHNTVRVYVFKDLNTGMTSSPIYFDLLQRPNKLEGANFAEELKPPGRYVSSNGTDYVQPSNSLVSMNVSVDAEGHGFLTPNQVISLIHEVGHAVHFASSRNGFPLYSSSNVPIDLVELPSQIGENLLTDPKFWQTIGHHFKNEKRISDALAQKLASLRYSFPALRSLARRNMMTELDYAWHTITEPVAVASDDFDKQTLSSWKEFSYLLAIAGSSSFNPYLFMHGYESRFHGYQWSEVLEFEDYNLFHEAGVLNSEAGGRMRAQIQSRGALVQPREDHLKFLGHEPDPLAIIRKYRAP
jgi:peptidyl-dipeptidase Dcp